MSKTVKWVLIIIIVAVLAGAVWMSGVLGNKTSTADQPAAAAVAAKTPTNSADISIKDSMRILDTQIAASASTTAALGTAPTAAAINAAARQVQTVATNMSKMTVTFQARAVTNNTSVQLQKTFNDLGAQLSNATSNAAAAAKNASSTSASTTTLSTSASQLKTAQAALVAARADLKVILATLKIQ
ncbi:MAG: hypothetical protein JWO43_97 [Candidatus Adlerbacteria bacterium]|nr:hypothetical protein [Candidatus Adlerbacteria bacterium]